MFDFLADVGLAVRALFVVGVEGEEAVLAVALNNSFLQAAEDEYLSAALEANYEVHCKIL